MHSRMEKTISLSSLSALGLLALSVGAYSQEYICKHVGGSWEWFGDHGAFSVTYSIVGQSGRTYEIGTGISINNSPWGSRSEHQGTYEATAYGIGALHIRNADGGEPFKVCASATGMDPAIIFSTEF